MNLSARKLRSRLTDAEQKLWRHIRKRQLMGFRFRRQAPIGKYIVDFVCFEQRLVIELDGGQHAVYKDYDHSRTEWLRSQGFKVIRFWKHDVMNNVATPHNRKSDGEPGTETIWRGLQRLDDITKAYIAFVLQPQHPSPTVSSSPGYG